MKAQKKKRSAKNSRFRPGSGGACEAQLWSFTGPQRAPDEENIPEAVWVAAESLDAALGMCGNVTRISSSLPPGL